MAIGWNSVQAKIRGRPILATLATVALGILASLAIFGLPSRDSSRPQVPLAAEPVQVGVIEIRSAEVPFPTVYGGRIASFRDVEVRPLVGGLLLKREFEEGATVKQGQVLFQIDPATYKVALSRAEAQLLQAQARLREADDNFARIDELFSRKVSTEKQRDEAQSARDQARASVKLAEAEIESARINLGYTVVNAPLGGVTALQSPPVGSLIQAQQTLLTIITPLDPAYVNFSFTDEEGRAFRVRNEQRAKPITDKDITIDLQFGNGDLYPHQGRIDTAAQRVDLQTGTIQARAIFPNPDGILLPGQFVRVRIRGVTLPNAILIPKQALGQGPQGPFVYVVGANGTAEVRQIELGPELPAGWVVEKGLKNGEQIVADGIIRVRPGVRIKAVPAEGQSSATPAAAPSDGARQ